MNRPANFENALGHSVEHGDWLSLAANRPGSLPAMFRQALALSLLLIFPTTSLIRAQSVVAPAIPVPQSQTPGGTASGVIAGTSQAALQNVAARDPNLLIGGGDLLALTIFGVPEMSGKFRVEEDGSVSFPLLGFVHAGGMTTSGLEHELASVSVKKELLRDPQVSVQIIEFATQGITIGGEVQRPGNYPALGGKHLYDILALGGGVTLLAGNLVTVFRHGESMGKQMELQDSYGRPTGGNISLYPGDTVIVQRAGIIYVLGDVRKPGGYVIDRRTMSVLQALTFAGGPTSTASLASARILRKDGPDYHDIPLDVRPILKAKSADLQLNDGDVLYVPISGAKAFFQASTAGIVSTLASAAIFTLNR